MLLHLRKQDLLLTSMAILLNFSLSSCLSSKSRDCRQLVIITNQINQTATSHLSNTRTQDILTVAQSFADTAQQLKKLKIADKKLNAYTISLANIYQNYASTTRDFVDAFEQKEREKALFYKNQVSKLFQEQEQLVEEINNYCSQ